MEGVDTMSDTIITRLLRLAARAWDAQVEAYRVLEDRLEPWEAERTPVARHDTLVAAGDRV